MIGPKVPAPTPAEERAARKTVCARSEGKCEGCGQRPATEMHHRLYRSRGGHDTVDNLLHLCGGEGGMYGGNHSGCHGTAHTIVGESLGWSVKSGNDPAVIPVFHREPLCWTQAGVTVNAILAVELIDGFGQMRKGVA